MRVSLDPEFDVPKHIKDHPWVYMGVLMGTSGGEVKLVLTPKYQIVDLGFGVRQPLESSLAIERTISLRDTDVSTIPLTAQVLLSSRAAFIAAVYRTRITDQYVFEGYPCKRSVGWQFPLPDGRIGALDYAPLSQTVQDLMAADTAHRGGGTSDGYAKNPEDME